MADASAVAEMIWSKGATMIGLTVSGRRG